MRSSRTISTLNGFWVKLCWDSLYRCLYDLLLKVVLVLNPKPLHPKPLNPLNPRLVQVVSAETL